LDLAKAFNTVDHVILLSKIKYYGFREASYDFLCDYLSDRQQRARFRGELSDWGTVSIGVPQGSILGPLLFALYVNDLPTVVQYSILDLYADDAEMHCSHADLGVVEMRLQSDMDNVAHWLSCSRLFLNVLKSNSLLIGSRQRVASKTLMFLLGANY